MAKPHTYADEMAALDALTPKAHSARDAQHFRRIITARKVLADAQVELVAAVEAAREGGDSWTVIGAALGTTRQGAFRKFGHADGAEGGEVVPISPTRVGTSAAYRSPASAARKPAAKATPVKGVAAKASTRTAAKATSAASAKRAGVDGRAG